ncbi:unnamed protein product [Cyclocybe aegerita]|uniref:F-box domain-containing protein n=1 Tax=Cyclocybe aegerita TaxID=1973307 RepID=A0A8S0XIF4_CYCAE|nr:unnamed protein product [Cyclocybe aegerita]
MLSVNAFHDPFTTCLPTEIASLIFTFCVDTEQEIEKRIPLALSAVSRRWREIAQSTSALWTSIHLEFNSSTIQSSREEMLRHWLLHSSQRHLSIHLSIDCDTEHAFETRGYRTIINILNSHSYRWGKLSLQIPLHLLNLFRSEICGAPALYWLSIGITSKEDDEDDEDDDSDDADEDDQTAKFDLGGPLPAPRTVSISSCRLGRIRIDWTNVTDVDMFVPFISECLTLFATAPRLRECELINVRDDDYSADPSTPTFTTIFSNCRQPLDPLQSFLIRSSAPLKFLHIDEGDFFHYEDSLTNLLWTVPSLEELEIFGTCLFDEFWELLTINSEGNAREEQFLPMLTSLTLDAISDIEIEYELQEVCEADRGLGVPKRLDWCVNIESGHDEYYLDEATLQFFERLISDGLDFKLLNLQPQSGDMITYSRAYYDEMSDQYQSRSDS